MTSGAIVYDRDKVYPGPRLYNGMLIDINGAVLKRWKNKYLSAIAQGHYYAQLGYEQKLWGKYTMDDQVVWEKQGAIHHELLIIGDSIITFSKECRPYRGRLVDFDVIVKYDLEGKNIDSWSSWKNLKYLKIFHQALELDMPKLPFLPELVPAKEATPWGGNYDYYRFNSLQIIPNNERDFMVGCWLVTVRHGSMIFILDKDKKVVWKAMSTDIPGVIEGPHGAQILNNGNMLIFDNGRYRGQSRVIEIDPVAKKIIWEYSHQGLFTKSQGYAQRLPNGNTLITESENGRAIEVTIDGEIVWEYYNPIFQDDPRFPQTKGQREWIYRMTWCPDL